MDRRRFAAVLAVFLIFAIPYAAHGEEDVELSLDPPEAELDRQPSDDEITDPSFDGTGQAAQLDDPDTRTPQADANVPFVDENSYEGAQFSARAKILRFHRRVQTEERIQSRVGQNEAPHRFHLGLGANVIQDAYMGAVIDFQTTIAHHFTVGPVLSYYKFPERRSIFGTPFVGVLSVPGFGAGVSYYSRKPYDGIWAQAGLGYDSFRRGNDPFTGAAVESAIPLFFNFGWRFLEDSNNLTFAFGLGGRGYFFERDPRFLLALRLEIGLGWNVFPH